MLEYLENQVVEPGDGLDVSVETEAMRRLYPEYFDEQKPDYEWDEEDNLVAYIQFDSWPEEVFREFVAQNYGFALGRDVEVGLYNRLNPDTGGNPLAGFDADEERSDSEIDEPIYSLQKFIWAEGIVFKINLPNYPNDWPQAEVIKVGHERVKVRVRGQQHEKQAKMAGLDDILTWFESKTKGYQPVKIIECTCERCRKANSQPYEIAYHHFQNLQKIFTPQIQCYASGDLLRLDEISSFTQPEVRLTVLCAETDLPFFEEFYQFFKRQGDFKIELWEPGKFLAQPRPSEEILAAVNRAHLVVFMTSVDFDRSEFIQQGAGRAIQRFKTGDILTKVIQLKPFDWHDHPLFKKSGVQVINAEPIEMSDNRAEAWRQVAKQVHRDIEEWVKVLGKRNIG